jgi:hypothetical protein
LDTEWVCADYVELQVESVYVQVVGFVEAQSQHHYSLYKVKNAGTYVESFKISEGNRRFSDYFLSFLIVHKSICG